MTPGEIFGFVLALCLIFAVDAFFYKRYSRREASKVNPRTLVHLGPVDVFYYCPEREGYQCICPEGVNDANMLAVWLFALANRGSDNICLISNEVMLKEFSMLGFQVHDTLFKLLERGLLSKIEVKGKDLYKIHIGDLFAGEGGAA